MSGKAIGLLVAAVLLAAEPAAAADTLYKYRDEDGSWVYSDRMPEGVAAESLSLPTPPPPRLELRRVEGRDGTRLLVSNRFACPVEVEVELRETENAVATEGRSVRLVVAGGVELEALRVVPVEAARPYAFGYQYRYVLGRPGARHAPTQPYRAPFAAAREFLISQAGPGGVTHRDAASRHAVDITMPEGTAVYAARAGIVVDVATEHFRGGNDVDVSEANYVRLLHEDGSLAIYAHLRRESIRVRPGQRVERGEHIADSGNTGFTSGPHLHFDVHVNAGLALVSVPFEFEDGNGGSRPPREGEWLAAY